MVDAANGNETRALEIDAYIAGTVASEKGVAYFGHYGEAFVAIDTTTGKKKWEYQWREFPYFAAPAIGSDRVVFGGRDKHVHCVDKSTGASLWRFATRGRVDSSPVIVGNRVVVGSDDGRLYLVDLDSGKKIWSYELGKAIQSSPAVSNGWVYIGCEDGSLYAFGPPKR